MLNGIDGIALTKLDVLDGLETLKICVGYQIGGRTVRELPPGPPREALEALADFVVDRTG